jgi:predicted nucleic acid-binding protein
MSDRAFVDTNILVYARDRAAGAKQVRAEALMRELWETRRGRVSIQVLNEYFVTVTQKLKPGMARDDAWSDLAALQAWEPVPMDWRLLERARSLQQQHALSWWDALIVAAAQASGCDVLYSEDLADGAVLGGVRVVNPFAVQP